MSLWVANECNRALGQGSSQEEEAAHADLARAAKSKELDAWKSAGVFKLLKARVSRESAVGTRRVFTRKSVEDVKTVKARLVARGFQDHDLKAGIVDTSRCVSLRPASLQVSPLAALKKRKLWSLAVKNACLFASVLSRVVFLRALA